MDTLAMCITNVVIHALVSNFYNSKIVQGKLRGNINKPKDRAANTRYIITAKSISILEIYSRAFTVLRHAGQVPSLSMTKQ